MGSTIALPGLCPGELIIFELSSYPLLSGALYTCTYKFSASNVFTEYNGELGSFCKISKSAFVETSFEWISFRNRDSSSLDVAVRHNVRMQDNVNFSGFVFSSCSSYKVTFCSVQITSWARKLLT